MRFVLNSPIQLSQRSEDTIPAGATGTLEQKGEYHLQLVFDQHHNKMMSHWGNILILDKHDTEQEIWEAISPIGFTAGGVPCDNRTTGSILETCT